MQDNKELIVKAFWCELDRLKDRASITDGGIYVGNPNGLGNSLLELTTEANTIYKLKKHWLFKSETVVDRIETYLYFYVNVGGGFFSTFLYEKDSPELFAESVEKLKYYQSIEAEKAAKKELEKVERLKQLIC